MSSPRSTESEQASSSLCRGFARVFATLGSFSSGMPEWFKEELNDMITSSYILVFVVCGVEYTSRCESAASGLAQLPGQ